MAQLPLKMDLKQAALLQFAKFNFKINEIS
jgi:hypothetical protein